MGMPSHAATSHSHMLVSLLLLWACQRCGKGRRWELGCSVMPTASAIIFHTWRWDRTHNSSYAGTMQAHPCLACRHKNAAVQRTANSTRRMQRRGGGPNSIVLEG